MLIKDCNYPVLLCSYFPCSLSLSVSWKECWPFPPEFVFQRYFPQKKMNLAHVLLGVFLPKYGWALFCVTHFPLAYCLFWHLFLYGMGHGSVETLCCLIWQAL